MGDFLFVLDGSIGNTASSASAIPNTGGAGHPSSMGLGNGANASNLILDNDVTQLLISTPKAVHSITKLGGGVCGMDSKVSNSSIGTTPLQQSVYDLGTPMTDSVKRRGRPRGWTDARIRLMLSYLEENFSQFQTGKCVEFYNNLAIHLGDEVDQLEVREKLEKMVKQYEMSKRRQDNSWKWYRKMNQIFRGTTGSTGGGSLGDEDDSLDCSLSESDEYDVLEKLPKLEDGTGEDEENGDDDSTKFMRLKQKYSKLHLKYSHRYREAEIQLKKALSEVERLRGKSEALFSKLERDLGPLINLNSTGNICTSNMPSANGQTAVLFTNPNNNGTGASAMPR